MKNVRNLVESIVKGTLKTKIIAGAVAGTVVIGAVAGGVVIYKNVNNKDFSDHKGPGPIIYSDSEKIEILKSNIKGLKNNINALPEKDKSEDLMDKLEKLLAINVDEEYDKASSLHDELLKQYSEIANKYLDDMKNKLNELTSLDRINLKEEDLAPLLDYIDKLNKCVGSRDFNNYVGVYEEGKKFYEEALKRVGEQESNENKDQNPNGEGTENVSNGSTGSTGSTGSSNGTPNGGGSSSSSVASAGSSSSSTGNSTSSSTDSSAPSQSASAPTPAPAPEPAPTPAPAPAPAEPAVPAIPSGWKTDISNRIIGNHPNTNNYGDSIVNGYESMSTETYNFLYSLAGQVESGAISGSQAIAQIQGRSYEHIGLPMSVAACSAGKIEVDGCDYDTIYNALRSRVGLDGLQFMYCSVYYDANTNTSTATFVGVVFH